MSFIEELFSDNIPALLDYVGDAVTIIDREGVVLFTNKAFNEAAAPFNPGPFAGRNLREALAQNLMPQSCALKAIEMRQRIDINITYFSGLTMTWTSVPVLDDRGELIAVISTGRNISELVELQAKLEESASVITEYSQQLQELKDFLGVGNIVCSSEKMQQVLHKARKIANTDSSVMILGETGVGKEMVANIIHQSSRRREKAFLAINCSAIPDELLESELFGYDEGAFSGARKRGKKGLFEEANGGTIFLDEVGELPLKMQSKILRFLQERKLMRVGGHELIEVDVRIVSATNLTLKQLMNNANFRQDLFYRLSVIPIQIAPLRERRDDIFPLIRFFTKQFNLKYQKDVKIPARFMSRLYNYAWPGNIRELKNFVERLIALTEGREIKEEEFIEMLHLESAPQGQELWTTGSAGAKNEPGDFDPDQVVPLREALQNLEESLIRKAYQKTGSIVKTAKLLGINASTIHRKLNRETIRLH